jgi:hypothetical protein
MLHVNTDKLLYTENDKWQIRPLVRDGTLQRQYSSFETTTFGQKVISGHKSQSGLDTSTSGDGGFYIRLRNVAIVG